MVVICSGHLFRTLHFFGHQHFSCTTHFLAHLFLYVVEPNFMVFIQTGERPLYWQCFRRADLKLSIDDACTTSSGKWFQWMQVSTKNECLYCSSISVRHWVLTSLGWQRGKTLRHFTFYFERRPKHTRK